MTVIGIDVSKWDGNWDAHKARAAGAEFVFMKSSQACFVDQRFVANWKKAREAGIIRGAYHYLDYTRPAREQADFFADLLRADPGDLPPTVDFEQTREDNNVALARNYLREFVEQLVAHGLPPIIYTSPSFWKTYGETSSYWYQFPLWIANYTSAAAPILPSPWLNWNFWQFTEKGPGTVFGGEALNIDVNRFNGTLAELHVFAKRAPATTGGNDEVQKRLAALETRLATLEKIVSQLPETTPPPVVDPIPLSKATVIKSNAVVYGAPFNTFPALGKLNLGQVVEILETQSGWLKIKAPLGWVERASLKLEEVPDDDTTTPDPAEFAVCRASALNVRSGPGQSFSVIGWIQLGQRVKILERQNTWVKLETPFGWSQASYLTPA